MAWPFSIIRIIRGFAYETRRDQCVLWDVICTSIWKLQISHLVDIFLNGLQRKAMGRAKIPHVIEGCNFWDYLPVEAMLLRLADVNDASTVLVNKHSDIAQKPTIATNTNTYSTLFSLALYFFGFLAIKRTFNWYSRFCTETVWC